MTKFHVSIELWSIASISCPSHEGRWESYINAETVDDAIALAHKEMDRLGYHKARKSPVVVVVRDIELTQPNGWVAKRTA